MHNLNPFLWTYYDSIAKLIAQGDRYKDVVISISCASIWPLALIGSRLTLRAFSLLFFHADPVAWDLASAVGSPQDDLARSH